MKFCEGVGRQVFRFWWGSGDNFVDPRSFIIDDSLPFADSSCIQSPGGVILGDGLRYLSADGAELLERSVQLCYVVLVW